MSPRGTPSIARRIPARLRPRSRGQALVELALVLPVMLLLMLGALDLGRLFYAKITVTNAAKEAAYVAASGTGTFTAGAACNTTSNTVMCGATSEAAGGFVQVLPANVSATTCPSNAAFGTTASVTVKAPFTLITPLIGALFGGQTITLGATATAQCAVIPATDLAIAKSGQCTVPDLTLTSSSDASGSWSAAGFTGSVTQVPSSGTWSILAQSPSGGASAPCTSGVTIYKSAPTMCTVPAIGRNWYFDDYSNAWTKAGFTGTLTDNTDGHKVGSLSLTAGNSYACTFAMAVGR
jgi:Flp pilus assembly protein TadG